MTEAPIEGGLFRRNYVREAVPLADSKRARRRLLVLFGKVVRGSNQERFIQQIEGDLGVPYPYRGMYHSHEAFWEASEIGDALSGITFMIQLAQGDHERTGKLALDGARRILSEEQLHYRIDDAGGVHFLIDEEFIRVSDAALAGLGDPRFAAAKHALDEALANLGPAKQSGKALIRGVFEAVESAFLVVIGQPSVNRLNGQAIEKHLKPILMARYAGYGEAEDKVNRAMDTFKAWVTSAHPFRHGAPLDQIHEAPLDLAVMTATQGMGFLRYLVAP